MEWNEIWNSSYPIVIHGIIIILIYVAYKEILSQIIGSSETIYMRIFSICFILFIIATYAGLITVFNCIFETPQTLKLSTFLKWLIVNGIIATFAIIKLLIDYKLDGKVNRNKASRIG